jgi:hypothetical protein
MTKQEATMTIGGQTTKKDMLAEQPDDQKKCQMKATACADNTSCKSYVSAITADMDIASVKAGMVIETKNYICSSGKDLTDAVCDASMDYVKKILGDTLQNIKTECKDFKDETVSSASGFGFGALLVAILFITL